MSRVCWAVMKVLPFEAMSTDRMKFHSPLEGEGQPQRFIPVFNTRQDAELFAGEESKELIVKMTVDDGTNKRARGKE